MAFIGMRHVVAAEISAHTDGSEPTYASGMVVGKAISGNLTKTYNDNPLYADDAEAENDNSLQSMRLELGVDDLTEEVKAYLGLLKAVTSGTTNPITTYYETSESPNQVGVGYIRVRRKSGTTSYQGIWIYKVQFQIENENSQTKGQSIEWNTPVANGSCFGIRVDSSGDASFRKIQNFNTYDAAEDWLDGLAGISA